MRIFPVPRTTPQSLIRWDYSSTCPSISGPLTFTIFDPEMREKSTGFAAIAVGTPREGKKGEKWENP